MTGFPRMLQYDLLTNLFFFAADITFVLLLRRFSSKPPELRATLIMFLGLLVLGGVSSNSFYVLAGLRSFAMLRSFGNFLFWHLPLCLGASAYIHRHSRARVLFFLGSAGFLLATYIFAYHLEPYRLQVTRYEFEHPSLAGLERPIVIAQVADIQTDRVGPYERRVLEKLAELSPDLILYCGDFVQISDPDEDAAISSQLRALIQELVPEPPLGSYAVLGDVDRPQIWGPLLRSGNIQLLADSSTRINLPGVDVDLVGLSVETSHIGQEENLEKAFKNTDARLLKLVLAHGPDHAARLDESHSPFLSLAGHTHGGQVQLPLIGPVITFSNLPNRLVDAFEPFGPGFLSVSRGIGMERIEAPRLRFLCRPELRLITLKPPSSD